MERSGTFPDSGVFPVDVTDDSGVDPARAQPCLAAITNGLSSRARIKTLRGERRAGDLRPGDLILTRDNGYQPLRWTGRIAPGTAPVTTIRIRKGALGRGVPEHVLLVAPEQRFLVGGVRLRHLLGLAEATVTATQLSRLKGVSALSDSPTTFVQLLFDRHELLLAEGLWTDSLLVTQDMLDQPPEVRFAAGAALIDLGPHTPARPPVPSKRLQMLLKTGEKGDLT
ncbi:Hint domain-containing protein [Antarctobacter sp.]|uniref:Hint domain-containing protein n=1 Tax=Antarctobacter sp. TaxID=1872577 RepID=UPI002B2738E9|nr:Hint domain-containing protein [Antarctobacter sp.]